MPFFRLPIRLFASLLLITVLGFWLKGGGHTGWSMDRVPVQKIDEITEIEYTVYEERYVPGLDVLAIGVAGAIVCFSLTFLPFFKSKKTS